ncbi:helix-turn-helix transcriptional regulator [Desulfovibrio oxyclinae]|uniref:helix-turn-helix transcriptional regulator n=1 Tax=Desulfovibrio oxyclinae TaxID=63560 RepID=UPI000364E752|nr:helix-turn-helix domain-containing protein [Desulfovibrio oxyclinae]
MQKQIVIRIAENGVVVDGGTLQVHEVRENRTEALRSVLDGIGRLLLPDLGERLHFSVVVDDPDGVYEPAGLDSRREWLSAKEVETEFGVSRQTLADLRNKGAGPQYSKAPGMGVRYRRSDIEQYLRRHRVQTRDQRAD